jgi:hypothetical protein
METVEEVALLHFSHVLKNIFWEKVHIMPQNEGIFATQVIANIRRVYRTCL